MAQKIWPYPLYFGHFPALIGFYELDLDIQKTLTNKIEEDPKFYHKFVVKLAPEKPEPALVTLNTYEYLYLCKILASILLAG